MLYTRLLATLICCFNALVEAIYADEAFVVDWQLSTIGEYNCIVSNDTNNDDQLIVLSDYSDTETLISYLNETSGNILLRYTVPSKMFDVMLSREHRQLVFKTDKSPNSDYISINLDTGLIIQNDSADITKSESFTFSSSCAPKSKEYMITTKADIVSLQVLDHTMNLPVFEVELPDQFKEIKYFYTDFAQTLKFIVVTDDGQYTYYNYTNGGKNVTNTWSRDESLADIVDSSFCDIKDHSIDLVAQELSDEKNIRNIFEAYIFRVKNNYKRAISVLQENRYSPGRVLTQFLKTNEVIGGNDNEIIVKRNLKFGLAKLLIVATKHGKIAALDVSQKGKIVWTIDSDLENVLSIEYNDVSQEISVIDCDGSYIIYSLLNEYISPIVKTKSSFKLSSKSTITKIKALNTSQNVYFVSVENGSNEVVSMNGNIPDEFESYYVTSHDENSINGYTLSDGKLIETWNIKVGEGDSIVAFASRTDDPVVNVGIVLGNRTVLYKYLYPNLVSYAVANEEKGSLYINLIDTITGELLHSQKHTNETIDLSHPINIVFGENWYVYSYFSSEPIPEQKLTVVELYESFEPNKRESNANITYNPLRGNINKPEVASKSYFFPEVIKGLGLSSTKFSIATTAIIIKLENEQITFVPKFVLNARSKEESKMTDDDKKEFMVGPYVAGIPINDNFIITHHRELLMGADSKLVSSATNLESTTLVCEIGHDVFCTRIYPSGQFDVMSPSFQKLQLMGTIFVIIVVLFYLRPSVAAKKLKTLWLVKD